MLLFSLVVGCDDPIFDTCTYACASDLFRHPLAVEQCQHSGECPAGSLCDVGSEESDTDDTDDSECGGEVAGTCVLDRGIAGGGTAELQAGFLVKEMVSRIEGPTIRWTNPRGVSVTWCALFACRPDFVQEDEGREGTAVRIANWNNCVVGARAHPADATSMDISALEPLDPTSEHECEEAAVELSPLLTQFSVGCWAYGDTDVIAGSKLWPIAPELVAGLREPWGHFVPEVECGSKEGWSCYRAGETVLGTCSQGTCRERCMSDADCESGVDCEFSLGQHVGACALRAHVGALVR